MLVLAANSTFQFLKFPLVEKKINNKICKILSYLNKIGVKLNIWIGYCTSEDGDTLENG